MGGNALQKLQNSTSLLTPFKKYFMRPNNYSSKTQSHKQNYHNLTNSSTIKKLVTSGASRNSFLLKQNLPIQFKYKYFFYSHKSSRGRSSKSNVLCRTKGRISVKRAYPYSCKSFRLLSIAFIAGYFVVPFKLKFYSLVILSSGKVTYVNSSNNHSLFKASKLYSVFETNLLYSNKYDYLSTHISIPQLFFLIIQLPKYKHISNLEVFPQSGIKYVRGIGCGAFINKVDKNSGLSLIKLPSGVHKVFSIFSVGSIEGVPFFGKNVYKPSNAGFFKKLGKKSLSRGVAKNPFDHPHGGRAKAIKYQRTPWGKTTKYK